MKNKGLILIMLLGLVLVSCKKDIDQPQISNPEKMSDLKVAEGFEWKTFSSVILDLSAPSNGLVSVVSNEGKVFQKAYLTQGATYTMKLTVPQHTRSVHLLYKGQDVVLNLDAEHLAWSFN